MTDVRLKALDGREFGAYLAEPAVKNGPALILIQEIFGVNEAMRRLCDAYAAQGYYVLCPDLFWRQTPNVQIDDRDPAEWPRAFEYYKNFDIEAGVRDLLATLAHMRRLEGANGLVGAVGYSLGGKLAYLMASRSDVECAVSYYGIGLETMLDEAPDIRMPFMLHLGEQDKFAPPPVRDRLLRVLGRNPVITTHLYAGAEHAFARPNGQAFQTLAAQQANNRTFAFLTEFLRDKKARR